MKKFIKKNWSLIGLIVGFLIDNTFDILDGSVLTQSQIKLIQLFGAIIAGYYWTSSHNINQVKNNI
jgi:hypothetical protein